MTDISEQPMGLNAGDRPVPKLPKHAYPDGPRSLQSLFTWFSGAIKVYFVLEIIVILSWAFLLWLSSSELNGTLSYEQQSQINLLGALIGIAEPVGILVCAIFVGRVVYRAMRNLHTISNKKAKMSPAWTVGWYFIPIANLWKPAEGMSQVYHGTYDAVGKRSAANSPIPLWWTFWLLNYLISNISQHLSRNVVGRIYEYSSTVLALNLANSVCLLISAYLLSRILKRVVDRQEAFKHGGVMTVFD